MGFTPGLETLPEQQASPPGAKLEPRPYVDLPISLGRLRTLRGAQLLSWLVAVCWMFGVTHPGGFNVAQTLKQDENALSPASPVPVTIGDADLQPHLVDYGRSVTEASEATESMANSSTVEWFGAQLESLGLVPTYHDFQCAPTGEGSGSWGRNVYSVLRAAHTKGIEAIVLAVPLPSHGKRLGGAAIALGLARAMLRGRWLSKSVILVGFDAGACIRGSSGAVAPLLPPGHDALHAWLRSYISTGGLPVHGGLIREAIILDIDSATGASGIERLSGGARLAHEGHGGRMPNLDMIAAVTVQFQEATGGHVPLFMAAPTLTSLPFAATATASLGSAINSADHYYDGIGCSSVQFGMDSLEWPSLIPWRCMLQAYFRIASGQPAHAHSAFLPHNIDAVTLIGRAIEPPKSPEPVTLYVILSSKSADRN